MLWKFSCIFIPSIRTLNKSNVLCWSHSSKRKDQKKKIIKITSWDLFTLPAHTVELLCDIYYGELNNKKKTHQFNSG